jgi:SOS-response transcriptional repressor LexA
MLEVEEMAKITPKQKAVLEAILTFTEEKKYPPSIRELCDILNLKSSSTMHGYLERLKLRGLVTWEEGCTRTIQVVEKGALG